MKRNEWKTFLLPGLFRCTPQMVLFEKFNQEMLISPIWLAPLKGILRMITIRQGWVKCTLCTWRFAHLLFKSLGLQHWPIDKLHFEHQTVLSVTLSESSICAVLTHWNGSQHHTTEVYKNIHSNNPLYNFLFRRAHGGEWAHPTLSFAWPNSSSLSGEGRAHSVPCLSGQGCWVRVLEKRPVRTLAPF